MVRIGGVIADPLWLTKKKIKWGDDLLKIHRANANDLLASFGRGLG